MVILVPLPFLPASPPPFSSLLPPPPPPHPSRPPAPRGGCRYVPFLFRPRPPQSAGGRPRVRGCARRPACGQACFRHRVRCERARPPPSPPPFCPSGGRPPARQRGGLPGSRADEGCVVIAPAHPRAARLAPHLIARILRWA